MKTEFNQKEFAFVRLKACILSISYNRQEQTETLLLKRKAKDLETEFRQLQLECQGKESQIIALENEVEVMMHILTIPVQM